MEIMSELRMSLSKQTRVSLSLSKPILLSKDFKDDNIVFSPLSIYVVLGMISVGTNGRTRGELLEFLKSSSIEDLNSLSSKLVSMLSDDACRLGGPTLSFANSVWVDSRLEFKPEFKQVVDNTYKADVSNQVDFKNKADEAAQQVNLWAYKKTNGLIKQIFSHSGMVNHVTKLIFANALYFKGTWDQKFDATKTKNGEFFLLDGTSIQVPFMTSKKKQYIKECNGFKVLKLPYKQGEDQRLFSMLIYLPDDKDGLLSLIEKVKPEKRFIEDNLPDTQVAVDDFRIPKFKIEFGFEASHCLKKLNLIRPFSEGGLKNMVQDTDTGKKLYVSNIYHKSFIEVNEEGTEVAAASACVVGVKSAFMTNVKPNFVADHPFLFIIRENSTGVVFFVGKVQKPA